jgi:hypothetical protein
LFFPPQSFLFKKSDANKPFFYKHWLRIIHLILFVRTGINSHKSCVSYSVESREIASHCVCVCKSEALKFTVYLSHQARQHVVLGSTLWKQLLLFYNTYINNKEIRKNRTMNTAHITHELFLLLKPKMFCAKLRNTR